MFNEYQTNHTDDLKKSVIEIDNNATNHYSVFLHENKFAKEKSHVKVI